MNSAIDWIRLCAAVTLLIVGVNIAAADDPGYWSILGGACLGLFVGLVFNR